MKLLPLPDRLMRECTADDAWAASAHPADLLELVQALADVEPADPKDAAELAAIAATGDRLRREVARAGLAVFEHLIVRQLDGRNGAPTRMGWFATRIHAGVAKLRAALATAPLDVAAVREIEALGDLVHADRDARRSMSSASWMQSTMAVDALSKVASIALAPRGCVVARGMQLVREIRHAHDLKLSLDAACRELADALREHVHPDLSRFEPNDLE